MDKTIAGRRGIAVIGRCAALLAAALIVGRADVTSDTRDALGAGDFGRAEHIVQADRAAHGVTPEMLEAASWIARADLQAGRIDEAAAQAKQVRALCATLAGKRSVDSSPSLALALGAAIEVQAQAMAARNQRSAAVAYLRTEFSAFGKTSIAARIRKNINMLSLEGKPAPPIDVSHSLAAPSPALAALRGRPVLLFFWAHWCGDCKADAPIIAKLAREYASSGLAVIAPTQLYGYTAQNDSASPQEELNWTRTVFNHFYAEIPGVAVPVSAANFNGYGASTTPTIVLIDRAGIVRLYHPGAMTEEELKPTLERITVRG